MENNKSKYINSINLNSQTSFPYFVVDVVNDDAYPRNPGFHVMHWHSDLQFIYVLDGEIIIKTLDEEILVKKSEGVFINKEIVHYIGNRGNCHYNSFLFPEYFLMFYNGSPAKSFVDQITKNKGITICHFVPDESRDSIVLENLNKLSEIEHHKTEFYSYEVLTLLTSLWLSVCKAIKIPNRQIETAASKRMQKMLKYMSEHYADDMTLNDLAESASVSKSECARCFKESLSVTPYNYLIEMRLEKAAELLRDTDLPIGEICIKTGFHLQSYFGKVFREKTGYSPREYRKHNIK